MSPNIEFFPLYGPPGDNNFIPWQFTPFFTHRKNIIKLSHRLVKLHVSKKSFPLVPLKTHDPDHLNCLKVQPTLAYASICSFLIKSARCIFLPNREGNAVYSRFAKEI